MTRQEEILKGLNESWGQNGINISSNTANSSNGITVNNPTGSGRAVELNFVDGINPTRLTAAQIALLPNPQAGQIVYQTDGVVGLYTYDGTSWVTVKGSTTVFGTTNRISVTGGDTIDIASTYVGQTSITTLGTVTTGTWGAVIGQATMALGSDATGDIYYRDSGGKLTRLGIGSAGQVLGVSAGIPAWQAAGGGITVGTTTITSGTSGRIAFNNAGVYGESANLFWDNANGRLAVGGIAPNYNFSIMRNAPGTQVGMQISNNSSGTSSSDGLFVGLGVDNNAYVQSYDANIMNLGTGSNIAIALNINNTKFNGTLSNASSLSTGSVFELRGNASTSGLGFFQLRNNAGTPVLCANENGKVAININAVATAQLQIAAGTAAAGSAPLKLTAGTNLTTPENGAFEFDGTNLYFTVGGVRKTVTLV